MTKNLSSVVFIDLDDTILEGPFESFVFPTIFNELSEKSKVSVSDIRRIVATENFSRQGNPNIAPLLAMDWDDIVQTIAAKLDIQIDQGIVLKIVKSCMRPPFIKLFVNAQAVLNELIKQGHYLVAVTKGLSKYQAPLIKALGIQSIFTEILTPDTYGFLKNDIRFYGNWPSKTDSQIIVGDHFMDDVVYPKQYGFKCIWCLIDERNSLKSINPLKRPDYHDYPLEIAAKPDAIIYSLDELVTVVDNLNI